MRHLDVCSNPAIEKWAKYKEDYHLRFRFTGRRTLDIAFWGIAIPIGLYFIVKNEQVHHLVVHVPHLISHLLWQILRPPPCAAREARRAVRRVALRLAPLRLIYPSRFVHDRCAWRSRAVAQTASSCEGTTSSSIGGATLFGRAADVNDLTRVLFTAACGATRARQTDSARGQSCVANV